MSFFDRFKNNEPLKTDKRITVVKEGRKRKVIIKDAKVTDAGNYKCTTNADETTCELIVNCKLLVNLIKHTLLL